MEYKKITQEELDKLLDEHEKQLRQPAATYGSLDKSLVDFKYCDLSGLSLAWRNLLGVTFEGAVLINTNFEHSVLNLASFEKSYIEGCVFKEASLNGTRFNEAAIHTSNFNITSCDRTIFDGAEITECDFSYAKLTRVTLWDVRIRDSNFFHAEIDSSILNGCFIERSRFIRAGIYNSTTGNIKLDCPFEDMGLRVPLACPSEGAFIGFKKAQYFPDNPPYKVADNYCIIKLLIPEQEKRSSATGRKCRCSGAIVLDIRKLNGEELSAEELRTVHSMRFWNFKYTIGQYVKPLEDFDPDRWNECSTGIHFFITREEAENYDG